MRLVFLSTPPPLLLCDGDMPVPSGPPLPAGLVRQLPPPPEAFRQSLNLLPSSARAATG